MVAMSDSVTPEPQLPADMTFGTATASWQVEGDVDGRGRCIWDDFAEIPGAIVDGTTGEPACDHLARFDEDLDLLTWLGVDAYRMSISWPRVQPRGSGPVSEAGLATYDRMIDGLLERGIDPVVTLYHWDLPSELPGWTSRETAERFADYAEIIGARLGDRVSRWATLNEPWVSAYLGYAAGVHAPGHRDPAEALSAAYHLMLGHGLALERLRAQELPNLGIVLNLIPVYADDPGAAAAATHIDGLHNRFFLDLLAGRGIPADVIAGTVQFTDWSFVRDSDLSVIAAPIDWLGENYYTVNRVSSGASDAAAVGQDLAAYPGCPPAAFAPREPVTAMGWEVYPEGIVDALRLASDALPGVPLWIAENGAAYADVVEVDGIHDAERVDYYRQHVAQVLRARDEGVNVQGYLAWSLLDNIEWAEGFTKRFGIVRVEPVTLERMSKDSALWWRDRLAARVSP
jgi:beta-glucosidase